MDMRLKAMHTVAIVLVAGVVLSYFLDSRPTTPENPPWWQPGSQAPTAAASRRVALGRCLEHAQLVHDLQWASACMQVAEQQRAALAQCVQSAQLAAGQCDSRLPVDDAAECTLPHERAAALNATLDAAEDRCVDDHARAASSPP